MGCRWFGVIALVAGCNQIYGLDSTRALDAAPMTVDPDEDMDGVADAVDNCRTIANPNQHDEDLDTVGDACDNCPLIANGLQENIGEPSGETDDVGDACDPNPRLRDCLALFDSFLDPTGFDQRWERIGAAASVTPEAEQIRLAGALITKELSDRMFHVQTTGYIDGPMLPVGNSVMVASNITAAGTGHACTLVNDAMNIGYGARAQMQPGGGQPAIVGPHQKLSADEIVGTAFTLRMTHDTRSLSSHGVVCRADHGYAVGVARAVGTANNVESQGAPGFFVPKDSAIFTAIAVYELSVAGPCAPIRR